MLNVTSVKIKQEHRVRILIKSSKYHLQTMTNSTTTETTLSDHNSSVYFVALFFFEKKANKFEIKYKHIYVNNVKREFLKTNLRRTRFYIPLHVSVGTTPNIQFGFWLYGQ